MPLEATPVNVVKEVHETAPVPMTTAEKPMLKYVDKLPLTTKARSFTVSPKQLAHLSFVFQNENGDRYNLKNHPITHFKASLYEAVSKAHIIDVPVAYNNAENGLLDITLKPTATKLAGVYTLVVRLYLDDKKKILLHENDATVYIASASGATNIGPPTLLEIRLQLRDSSAEENSLLDGYNFSDEEMAIATMRPIQFFNESDPDVGIYYNTFNFPSRYYWTEGIIAQLFRIVEEYHRKNNLQYNSGGLAVDDRNKEQNYAQAGERHWMTFVDWVKRKKVKINIANGYGTVHSYYAYRY